MKTSTLSLIVGSIAGGAVLASRMYKKKQTEKSEADKDTHWRASEKIDDIESVYAEDDQEEKGLTQFDSAHRNDWIANRIPDEQARKELEELKNNQ
ncbi:hypothetical protein MM300_21565 [Evansella sp. LMS18]|uniref:hypothetical protein n=1 Tax=Evansella sp. LMS18 TaxID=2924033 RepID=UPI0020D1C022|nr:hypothetical protein [Evansella sp. LMS18]UTR10424.1 hypothetical protein MM300_21565 [Evansella sp. LMS18]